MSKAKATSAALAGIFIGTLGVLAAPSSAYASEYCTPNYKRSYTQTDFEWYKHDSGTINNTSSGSVTKSFTHTFNASLTTSVSSEVGVKADVVVAEINAKLGLSVSVTASITTSTTFSVTAPKRTKISYKDGIAKRTYSVKKVQTYSNCNTKTTYGSTVVADNYSEVKDA